MYTAKTLKGFLGSTKSMTIGSSRSSSSLIQTQKLHLNAKQQTNVWKTNSMGMNTNKQNNTQISTKSIKTSGSVAFFHSTSFLKQNNNNNGQGQSTQESQSQSNETTTTNSNNNENNQQQQSNSSQSEGANNNNVSIQELNKTIATQAQEIATLKTRTEDLQKKLAYSYADMQNFSRSKEEEINRIKSYSLQSFAKDLLDVSDNLERCISSVKKSEISEENKSLRILYEAIEMTNNQFYKSLGKNQISPFTPKGGEKFNPDQMEAIMEMDSDQHPAGTVAYVMRRGFLLKDRVIRAAQVGVVKSKDD